MPLTREEQESTWGLTWGAEFGGFSTSNPAHMRHMERLGLKPDRVSFMDGEPVAWVYNHVPAKWFRLPKPPRQLSEEAKAKHAERLRKMREQDDEDDD